ncbi:MAG: rod shape-determining protein MreD [Bacteroidales bacterium]|nr:rod shape-determining protein MreD [Bacteroidales bacterium]
MNREIIKYSILFIVMLILQVLVFNRIVLFNVAVPMVFIYFFVKLPIGINKILLFSLAFVLGFLVDLFSDTLGVNSLACTLIAAAKRPMFFAYVQRDDRSEEVVPGLISIGIPSFMKFLFTFSFAYCLMAFCIEYFSFADVKDILIMTASSGVLTFLLMLGFDSLIITTSEKRS